MRALVFAVLPVLIALLAVDASARRAARERQMPAAIAVGRRLGTTDLALSGGARWLRAPSLEEPWAAFADAPAAPDPDPAGGAMSPPRELWSRERQR
jgi:hypothetical protein